jgi:hypothetical protein
MHPQIPKTGAYGIRQRRKIPNIQQVDKSTFINLLYILR